MDLSHPSSFLVHFFLKYPTKPSNLVAQTQAGNEAEKVACNFAVDLKAIAPRWLSLLHWFIASSQTASLAPLVSDPMETDTDEWIRGLVIRELKVELEKRSVISLLCKNFSSILFEELNIISFYTLFIILSSSFTGAFRSRHLFWCSA